MTTTTKSYAAQNATSTLEPYTIQRRETGEHDVKIVILYCGICHSDIHQARNEWGRTTYPIVPGHEMVGRVSEVGSKVKRFAEGDLVGVGCLVGSCSDCGSCKKGLEQYCDNGFTGTYNAPDTISGGVTYGGYSKEIVVTENFVLHVSEKLPITGVAPLLCAGITTYSPLKHRKVGAGHTVGILGLGGLGHMAVKFASSFGAEVTMLSRSPEKAVDADALGADHFVLTTEEGATKKLAGKFDFIIDTVSAQHDYTTYLEMLKVDGTLICLGVPPTPAQIGASTLIMRRRTIAGSLIGGLAETQEMLDYCAEHNIISDVEVISADYINKAYERVLEGDVKYRFVIDMSTL